MEGGGGVKRRQSRGPFLFLCLSTGSSGSAQPLGATRQARSEERIGRRSRTLSQVDCIGAISIGHNNRNRPVKGPFATQGSLHE